ncbi:hypothetical protein J6590_053892, partial [Homalodisca vitripennis]
PSSSRPHGPLTFARILSIRIRGEGFDIVQVQRLRPLGNTTDSSLGGTLSVVGLSTAKPKTASIERGEKWINAGGHYNIDEDNEVTCLAENINGSISGLPDPPHDPLPPYLVRLRETLVATFDCDGRYYYVPMCTCSEPVQGISYLLGFKMTTDFENNKPVRRRISGPPI